MVSMELGLPLSIQQQSSAALQRQYRATFSRILNFPLPMPGIAKDLFTCHEDRHIDAQQLVQTPAKGFEGIPAVQTLRCPVPVGDAVFQIAHDDSVVGVVQQRTLLEEALFADFNRCRELSNVWASRPSSSSS